MFKLFLVATLTLFSGFCAFAQLTDSSGNPVTDGSGNPVRTGAQEAAGIPVVTGIPANGVDGSKYCNCNTDGSPLVSQLNRDSWDSYLAESGTTTGTKGAGSAGADQKKDP